MTTEPSSTYVARPTVWSARQVAMMSAFFLVLGLSIGYFFLGAKILPSATSARLPTAANPVAPTAGGSMANHPVPTMDQMKQMAAVQTSALLEKLKGDPKNVALLVQIASVYKSSHQFKDAAEYYNRALKIEPKNVTYRTEMASCLYYSGDVDGALDQLNQSLKLKPTDPNSLFNLGMIKYQGKKDPAGAIAAWEQLLKTNPNLERKPAVEQMIAEAKASPEPKN
ncbi:MAG: tetratricopeptide repeat protein [Candidatus Acidiferrum sp.]